MGKIIRIKNCRSCPVTPQIEWFRKCRNWYRKSPAKSIPRDCELDEDLICEFYPHKNEGCICAANSDISGTFVCTKDFSEKCQWANQKRKEESNER